MEGVQLPQGWSHFQQTFNIDIFILKCKSILKADLCIFIFKYVLSRFSKLIYIFFKLRSLRYTSFQQNSRRTNKVLLRYKQSINLFFLFLYFSNTSHEPYLKYTYSMLPTVFYERGNCIVVSLQYFCLKKQLTLYPLSTLIFKAFGQNSKPYKVNSISETEWSFAFLLMFTADGVSFYSTNHA